jgi:protein TonB
VGDPSFWITNDDYPPQALLTNQQGTVGFKLTVGPDGIGTKCEIVSSSGYPLLDTTTCSVMMRRARFEPGVDENGDRLGLVYRSRMHWTIPDVPNNGQNEIISHPVPGQSVIAFTIGTDGRASDCQLVSGPDPTEFILFSMPCEFKQVFPVYSDAGGKPVARRVRIAFTVSLPGTTPTTPKKRR